MRLLAASVVLAFLASAFTVSAEWPQFHADPMHSGIAQGAFLPPTERWWSQATGGPIEGSPVVSDGRVFVGSTDGKLYAFDAVTGDPLWTFDAGGPISSTPALSGGVLYLVTNPGKLFALDAATGRPRLSAGAGNPDPGPTLTSPSIHQGRLYVATEAGSVIAYSLQTLTKDWEYKIADEVLGTNIVQSNGTVTACTPAPRFAAKPIRSSPAVYDNKVFFGSDVHALFAVDEFGRGGAEAGKTQGVWPGPGLFGCPKQPLPAPSSALVPLPLFPMLGDVVRSSPAIDAVNGLVIVASYDNTVRAYRLSDGGLAWNFTVALEGRDSRVISTPAVSDGVAYFGSFNGRVYALETVSSAPHVVARWTFQAGDAVWSSPALAGGLLAFGADDETVYVIDAASGEERWRARIGGDVRGSPAIANGVLYVAGSDGGLHAFGRDRPPLPDLQVADIAYPSDPLPLGETVEVRIAVRNNGTAPAPATELQLHIDGALASAQAVPALAPGADHTVTYAWHVTEGNHTLVAALDPAGFSREYDRANNALRVATPVAEVPPPPPPPPEEQQQAPPPAEKPKKKLPGFEAALLALAGAVALAVRRRVGR